MLKYNIQIKSTIKPFINFLFFTIFLTIYLKIIDVKSVKYDKNSFF